MLAPVVIAEGCHWVPAYDGAFHFQRALKAEAFKVTGTKPVCAALPWKVPQSGAPGRGASADRLYVVTLPSGEITSKSYGTLKGEPASGLLQLASEQTLTVKLPV